LRTRGARDSLQAAVDRRILPPARPGGEVEARAVGGIDPALASERSSV
jgi:hypothetical protein